MKKQTTSTYPPPIEYEFNAADQERFRGRFWRFPVRLVEDGTWAGLWCCGSRSASSVLPVLAVHVFPAQRSAEPGWTGWTYLSRRRLARLAGVSKDGTTAALRALAGAGHLETRQEPSERGPRYRVLVRLAARLYAEPGERYARIPAEWFYGGTWAGLPNAACRQLLVAIAALDPVLDEAAFLETKRKNGAGRHVSDEALLAAARARRPRRVEELARAAGLGRSTAFAALRVLTGADQGAAIQPQHPLDQSSEPIVRWGESRRTAGRWYAVRTRETRLHIPVEPSQGSV